MITRRQFLTSLLSLPLLSCLPAPTSPNVILILADDLALGDLGCYGQKFIATPHLDRLRAEGVLFTQYHAAAPTCSPTRWSLLTGYRPRTTRNEDTQLLPGEPVFPQRMASYKTGHIGKWGLSNASEGVGPWELFGYSAGPKYAPFYPPWYYENGEMIPLPGNQGGQQVTYLPDLLQTKALEFIGSPEPFCLLYTPWLPHIDQNREYPVPDLGQYVSMPWTDKQKTFAATVTRLDSYVGQIMNSAPPNTLILFTSDNGGYVDECYGFFNRGAGLRGSKGTVYQGGLNVPLLAWWPRVITPGASAHACTTYDLGATILEAAGLEAEWGDGISLLPALLGMNQPAHDHLYFAYSKDGTVSEAVRWGNWKAVRNGGGPVELYNLATDPGETLDLAASEPGVAGHLGQVMDGYCPEPKRCEVWLPGVMK